MPKARPKTGEERDTHQPLIIDRLPDSVHDAIRTLYRVKGLSWAAIAARSAKPYSKKWDKDGGGFIDWDSLDTDVLELFPTMRLASTTLHRWFDLRVAQARRDVMAEGDAAQKFVEQLGKLKIDGMNEAVQNAMTRMVFSLIQDTSEGNQTKLVSTLNETSLVLARLQRLQISQRVVDANDRKLKLLEERERLSIAKLEAETDRLAKKATAGQPVTPEELKAVRMKAFGF